MSGSITVEQVRAALALDGFDAESAQRRMMPEPRGRRSSQQPGQPRQAAVLILLFPGEDGLSLLLTRRSENPHDVHSGQISLPGGSQEAGETPVQTALRETREEVGFSGTVDILGLMTPLYIPPSDFLVHPVVGWIDAHPAWVPDVAEVAEVIECPVSILLDEAVKAVEDWDIRGFRLRVPWYDVNGFQVWGATAIILSEFEQRLRQVLIPGHSHSTGARRAS